MALKGAFHSCRWCGGTGCLQCDIERAKAIEAAKEPILTFKHEDLDDPTLGPLIRRAIGGDALVKAFGPGGGGMREIEGNCALASLVKALREANP